MAKAYINENLKIESDSPISNKVQVSIGGILIPVSKAVITFETGEWVTVELTTRADKVNVQALQEQTRLIIESDESKDG